MELDNENHFNAQFYSGYMYFHGLVLRKMIKRPIIILKNLIKREPLTNCYRCYYRGYGVKQNKNKD